MLEPSVTHATPNTVRLDQIYSALLNESDVPPHLHGGIVRYLSHHVPPGSFLRACLENNLMLAVHRADPSHPQAVIAVTRWLMRYAPLTAWTSPEDVQAWLAKRGR